MKRIITAIVVVTAIALLVACTSQSPEVTEIVVLRDITDNHLVQPNADEILTLFNPKSKWNGRVFHFTDLTNVSYNQAMEVKLEAQNEWLSNELDRDKEIKGFENRLTEILGKNERETIGKDNSSVYFPIAKELNRLVQSSSAKKILLIYSDLMENTREMSFYDRGKFSLLKTNPNDVKIYFDSQVELKNLSGITIYIIFQPKGIKEDEQFKGVSGFYKNLLESKGAEVEIAASIS
ncbi:MAG: hypothetical protein EHM93_06795 [Bacteroidales bacterium]|nr:MAG: hypothetical protein EHM93_06795 [Bacteroidales bacterium]